MYYVIQRHHNNPQKHYFAYSVIRYIAAKNTQNIIFEINQDGTAKRKWAPKEEIVLLTADKDLFRTTLERLETMRKEYLEKITLAQDQLNQEIQNLHNSMNQEFELIQKHSEHSINIS
ncbi:MAG TPA: hypothetical protein VFX57_03550 [Sulfuricurvum sp.]|nr:hypothetical protein [Sulfuricurvum sp.]